MEVPLWRTAFAVNSPLHFWITFRASDALNAIGLVLTSSGGDRQLLAPFPASKFSANAEPFLAVIEEAEGWVSHAYTVGKEKLGDIASIGAICGRLADTGPYNVDLGQVRIPPSRVVFTLSIASSCSNRTG